MRNNPVDVQTYIKNAEYPATKRELKEQAMENGAPESVLNALDGIPERAYESPGDVADHTRKSDSSEDGGMEENPSMEDDDVSKDNEDSDKAPEDDLADAGNLRLLERSLLSL